MVPIGGGTCGGRYEVRAEVRRAPAADSVEVEGEGCAADVAGSASLSPITEHTPPSESLDQQLSTNTHLEGYDNHPK